VDPGVLATVVIPSFDEEKVYKLFTELITNSKYKTNMLKLKSQSNMSGGRELVTRTVE
jgi:hypothetical protein